jgi:hypothetical protein
MNLLPKSLHKDFPENKLIGNWYNLMRGLRRYQNVYYVGMLVFCSHDVARYYYNVWAGIPEKNFELMRLNMFERIAQGY